MTIDERASQIELLLMDVDGVLTDGGLYYGPDGEAFKRFDVKDGHGIVLCRYAGLPAGILTARSSGMVEVRSRELQIRYVLQGRRDKEAGFTEILEMSGLKPEQIAYIGDDVNDLPVLRQVGLSACPSDARPEVRAAVHYICEKPGGHGAVRELCELLLKAQGRWDAAMARYEVADAKP